MFSTQRQLADDLANPAHLLLDDEWDVEPGDDRDIRDPEAILAPSRIGTPRSPTREYVSGLGGNANINYGTATSTVVYEVRGSSIVRTEDNIVTTIASSTDNLVAQTTDIEIANTEYTTTAITFQPISVADRNGTIVYSKAYLRNRRRPSP